jgi:hypothetical protein
MNSRAIEIFKTAKNAFLKYVYYTGEDQHLSVRASVTFNLSLSYKTTIKDTLPMPCSASNFFCEAAAVKGLPLSIGNTIEARDEDGGWDGGRDFFLF